MVYNKIAIIGIFSIIILVPAFVDFKLHSVEIGKLFLFALLLCIVVFAWVIHTIKSKTTLISNFLPNYFVVAFLAAGVIATVFSTHQYLSVFGCYNRYEGLLTWTMYILLYFLAYAFFNNVHQINLLLKIIVCSSVLPILYGILQYCGVDPLQWSGAMRWRVHSTFGNPVFFGGYLSIIFPVSLYLYLVSKRAAVWGIFTFAIFTTLLLTQTRGAIGTWLISILLFFILLGRRQLWQLKLRLSILAACIFFVGIYLNLFQEKKVFERFTREIVVKEGQETELVGGAAGRWYIWTACLKIIKDYPVWGIGPDTLEVVYPKYKTLEYVKAVGDYQGTNRAHNLFLDVYLSFGLIGFLSFFGFVVVTFLYFWRNLKQRKYRGLPVTIPLGVSILAYLLQTQFSFSTIPTSIFFWTMAGALMGYIDDTKKRIASPLLLKVVFGGVYLSVVILIVCLYFSPYVINHKFQFAEAHNYSGYKEKAEELYLEVLKSDPYKDRYWDTLINYYIENNAPDKTIATIKQKASIFGYYDYIDYFNLAVACEQKKDFTMAENYYKLAIKNTSYFGDVCHNLGLLYWQHLNKSELAEYYFEKALRIHPQKARYLHSLGSLYYSRGDWDKCIQLYEKITTLSPQYDEILPVRKTLAGIYQNIGQREKFITQCMEILNVKPNDLDALWGLAVVYYNDRSFAQAKRMCEQLLGYYPNHGEAKRMLGLIQQ